MTTTISPPIRILAIVGVLAAVALGILLFAHNRSASSSSSPAVPSVAASKPATHNPVTSPAKPVHKPKIVLLPGLPMSVAHALRSSKVVVVALYAHGVTGDKAAVAQARAGAKSAHAGFAAVNVVNEKTARILGRFAGTTTAPPAVLVVRRPGRIVNRFNGYQDSELVAQAAHNAGSGR